jgi:hypothetical protein
MRGRGPDSAGDQHVHHATLEAIGFGDSFWEVGRNRPQECILAAATSRADRGAVQGFTRVRWRLRNRMASNLIPLTLPSRSARPRHADRRSRAFVSGQLHCGA